MLAALLLQDLGLAGGARRPGRLTARRATGTSPGSSETWSARRRVLRRRILLWDALHRLFHYWHVVHKPFAIVMYLFVVVHVAVATLPGYGLAWLSRPGGVAGARPFVLPAAATARAQISPGELSRFHQPLEGARNCRRCHEAGKGVTALASA